MGVGGFVKGVGGFFYNTPAMTLGGIKNVPTGFVDSLTNTQKLWRWE